MQGDLHAHLAEGRRGADDENPRSNFASDGEEDYVVGGNVFQIERTRWRGTLAGCSVTVCEHLDQLWSIRYGPHVVGRYNAQGCPWPCEQKLDRRGKAVEKPRRGNPKAGFPLRLEIPQRARDSHFPTASATAVHRS